MKDVNGRFKAMPHQNGNGSTNGRAGSPGSNGATGATDVDTTQRRREEPDPEQLQPVGA